MSGLSEADWTLLNLAAIAHQTRSWKVQPDPAELLASDPGSLAVTMALDAVSPLVPAVEQIVARHVTAITDAVRDAFDPGELDCGRLGLDCSDVYEPDRWCRACRILAAITLKPPEVVRRPQPRGLSE